MTRAFVGFTAAVVLAMAAAIAPATAQFPPPPAPATPAPPTEAPPPPPPQTRCLSQEKGCRGIGTEHCRKVERPTHTSRTIHPLQIRARYWPQRGRDEVS